MTAIRFPSDHITTAEGYTGVCLTVVDDFGIVVTWDADWRRMRTGWWPEASAAELAVAARTPPRSPGRARPDQ
jgi:hypothetical protein